MRYTIQPTIVQRLEAEVASLTAERDALKESLRHEQESNDRVTRQWHAEYDALKAASGPRLAWFDEDRGPACHRCAECFTELEAPHTWAECIARVKERENAWLEMWLGGVEGPTAEQVRALRLELDALKIEHDRQYYCAQDFEERAEAAEEALRRLDGRRREMRQLLKRLTKYVIEDRAVTPGKTRLERLTAQVIDYLQRTADPNDILRTASAKAEGAGEGTKDG